MELQPQRLDPTSLECHVQVLTEQLTGVPTKQPTLLSPVLTNPVEFLYFSTQSSSFPPPKNTNHKTNRPVIFGIRQVSYQNVVRETGAPPVPLSLLLPVQDAEVQDRSAVSDSQQTRQ